MAGEDCKRRQRYSAETKARIVAECASLDASVARVAMSHGINANVVHRWRQRARERSAAGQGPVSTAVAGFVPVSVAEPVGLSRDGGDIRIELRRGATAMTICWPVAAAGSCALWLKELLH
jgi:transposase